MTGKANFVVDGDGTTLRAFDTVPADAPLAQQMRSHIKLHDNRNVVVKNLIVDGGVVEPHYPSARTRWCTGRTRTRSTSTAGTTATE